MIVDALIHEKQTVIVFNDFRDVQQSFAWKEAINLEEKKILKQVKKAWGNQAKYGFKSHLRSQAVESEMGGLGRYSDAVQMLQRRNQESKDADGTKLG